MATLSYPKHYSLYSFIFGQLESLDSWLTRIMGEKDQIREQLSTGNPLFWFLSLKHPNWREQPGVSALTDVFTFIYIMLEFTESGFRRWKQGQQ